MKKSFKKIWICIFSTYLWQKLKQTMQTKESLGDALGVENELALITKSFELTMEKQTLSEILNCLICSELNTKELVYCAFTCGRIQEMDNDKKAKMMHDFVIYQLASKLGL